MRSTAAGGGPSDVTDLIAQAERRGGALVEATDEAEDGWTATCHEIAHMTLFPKADSWSFGANIPGKKRTVMFYMGCLANYPAALGEVACSGPHGFQFGEGHAPGAGLAGLLVEGAFLSPA